MSSVANSFLFDDDGVLQTSAGPIASWSGGMPFDAAGNLVGTTGTPVATDPYVGGLRVSPTLGVYFDTAAPLPGDPWSSGFNEGFS